MVSVFDASHSASVLLARSAQLVLLAGLFVSLVGCGSSATLLESAAPATAVVADGMEEEWRSQLRPISKKPGVSVGVMDDTDAVYVALVISNADLIRQIAGLGFTLWLDPKGGTDEQYGLRFPIGLLDSGDFDPRSLMGNGRRDNAAADARLTEHFAMVSEEVIVIHDDRAEERRTTDSLSDWACAARYEAGTLTLEYRLPLTASDPFGLLAPAEGLLGLGFTTPEIDRAALREAMDGQQPPGGGGGMRGGGTSGGGRGGMGGGMPGGMGGMQRPSLPEPLDVWTQVQLVHAQTTNTASDA